MGLILVAVFLTVVLTVYGVYLAVVQAPAREQQKIVGYRVDSLVRSHQRRVVPAVELFKRDILTSLPGFQKWLLRIPRGRSLERALRQADWRISVTTYVLLSSVAASGMFLLANLLWGFFPLSLVLGGLGACVPYVVLLYRRRRRLDKFLAQFPEAIDLIARAIRAGHAVPSGFEMIAQEMPAPMAEEFRQTYDQQKFGLPLNQALLNLQERVPLLDVRMLSTAISIQREVGGNLSEVLDKIAHTIRERMQIRGQIRTFTAQGKLTGGVLGALPIVLALALNVIDREYFKILFQHEYGLFIVGVAALLELVGYFWIRKIIHIKI